MADPTQLLFTGGRPARQTNVMAGVVSSYQPLPTSFDDPLYVVIPNWDPNYYLTITDWAACHGAALPQAGAEAVLVRDDQNNLRCVWWDGGYSAPGLKATAYESGTYAAQPWDLVISSGPIVITLPNAPAKDVQVGIQAGDPSTVVQTSGTDHISRNGNATLTSTTVTYGGTLILQYDTDGFWRVISDVGSSRLRPVTVTVNYTAHPWEFVIINNVAGVTVTLPATPADGDQVGINGYQVPGVTSTVSGNGNLIWLNGVHASSVSCYGGSTLILQYNSANGDWRTLSSDVPAGPAGGVLSGTYPNPGFAALQSIQTFSYANSWRAYAGGGTYSSVNGYYKDPFGVVHLQGLIDKNGGNWVPTEAVITLPSGYWPLYNCLFAAPAAGGTTTLSYEVIEVRVSTTGSVTLGGYGAPVNPVTYLSLDGIHFRTT